MSMCCLLLRGKKETQKQNPLRKSQKNVGTVPDNPRIFLGQFCRCVLIYWLFSGPKQCSEEKISLGGNPSDILVSVPNTTETPEKVNRSRKNYQRGIEGQRRDI